MTVFGIIVMLIVVGVGLWLINAYVPMNRAVKGILNAVVVILVILVLLNAFGVLRIIPRLRFAALP